MQISYNNYEIHWLLQFHLQIKKENGNYDNLNNKIILWELEAFIFSRFYLLTNLCFIFILQENATLTEEKFFSK